MKVMKVTCGTGTMAECHDLLLQTNPNMISVLHNPDDHVLIMKEDYNKDGHVLKTAWNVVEENKLSDKIKNKMRIIYEREFR